MTSEAENLGSDITEKPNIKLAFLFLVFGVGAVGSFVVNVIWWAFMR